ncbi:hypothetical protein THAOC_16963 [Thalassiosira oceanica]|uniref:Uncharacterized protein n=1 Tax=Thalassiosira oceanica TaxID=159749 RepID=K0SVZ0_THAOC|nr:hypothetical protein THAOC_16963 [Thalassiosira oceanica]|mmetsp:Transcript_24445/g.58109  ORF Transcript_24445/g.58109 Transcript_24445/m.58109 type:complete len:203 (-) Transcript_24445:1045-1653(-)|eukprot:EJK62427.1 hypothetical protein THAOC_16963 [Thalassiosira oceanica]
MMKSLLALASVGSTAAFAPSMEGRASSSLASQVSKSIPFLLAPEKLDGTMPGDVGFDPMGLSDIQTDLRYARWAELKHGRVCMLAVTGMVWQEYFPHLPGAAYATKDPWEAISSPGFGANIQILLAIGVVELINWDETFNGDSRPGDIGWTGAGFDKLDEAGKAKRYEQEIVHCRLAMIAFIGATHQTFLLHKGLLDFSAPN